MQIYESISKAPKTSPKFVPNMANTKSMVQTIETVENITGYSYK